MDQSIPSHADIAFGPDEHAAYDDNEVLQETEAPRKKGGLPPFLKYILIGFIAVVVLLISLYAYVLIRKAKANSDDDMAGGVAMQQTIPTQVPQPQMNAPVPVYGNGAQGGPQFGSQAGQPNGPQMGAPMQTQPMQHAQQPMAGTPPAQEPPVTAPPAQAVPAAGPAIAPSAPPAVSQPAIAAPGTQPQAAAAAPAIDARSAQTLHDWPRERDEIMKRLSTMDARLDELGRTLKALNDNRAAAPSKFEPKAEPKTVRKDPPAAKSTVKDEEADHKREAAAGVVRGVPRGAATKPATQVAKTTTEPTLRRDYYLSGWVGDMAFYRSTGREEREGSVKPGDMIDGMKVQRIDTQNRRIVLEGNQYIGTR